MSTKSDSLAREVVIGDHGPFFVFAALITNSGLYPVSLVYRLIAASATSIDLSVVTAENLSVKLLLMKVGMVPGVKSPYWTKVSPVSAV